VRRAAGALLLAVALLGFGASAPPRGGLTPDRILVFTKTTGFRHDSIPAGIAAVSAIGGRAGLEVDATENAAFFTPSTLAPYRVVVFLNTTGDVLDAMQESALQAWVKEGGGFVGVHSAADTEHGWPWYRELLGARFRSHPAIQPASIRVEWPRHPATRLLPSPWMRTDEWYNFDANPRASVAVLLTLEEASYSGGDMGADHPIAWCRILGAGRSFYTGGGHTAESYAEPDFVNHLSGGLRWAAGLDGARLEPRLVPPR
jgi:type 1 glutamine amidotransferase